VVRTIHLLTFESTATGAVIVLTDKARAALVHGVADALGQNCAERLGVHSDRGDAFAVRLGMTQGGA